MSADNDDSPAARSTRDSQQSGRRSVARDPLLAVTRAAGRLVFGDRTGLALFLGAVLWLAATWRIGIFIQDTVAVASALANVGAGRLALVDIPYSLSIGPQPGVVEVGGQSFGRNYGHVLLALPVLYLLKGLSALVAPKLLLAGGWSLGLLAFASQVARVTGRQRIRVVGSVAALLVFVGNVAVARAIPDGILALVALQLTTMLVGAYIAVVLYRLVARFHGRRVGLVAGVAVVVATPVGFWATIPKRHVVTAAAAVVVLFLFAVSREGTGRRALLARAGAYATLGLLTTVHPFEAFFLFLVFVVVDLVTAPSNDGRTLVAISLVFFLSLVPFFVLNTLISGNPVQSPRMIGGFERLTVAPDLPSGGGSAGGASGGGATGSEVGETPSGTGPLGVAANTVDTVVSVSVAAATFAANLASFVTGWLADGLAALTDIDRLSHIFLRSGGMSELLSHLNDYEAIELTLLESFPLLAALVWLPVRGIQHVRTRTLSTPQRQTDLLAAGFVVVVTLIYLPKLPLHSQITVRYLLPVVPLLVYAVARLSFVHRAVRERPRWLAGGYLMTVVVGGVGVALVRATLDPAIGEMMQLHALLGLLTAGVTTAMLGLWPFHRRTRLLALGGAIPAGMTTVFLAFATAEYFAYRLPTGQNPHVFAIDLVRLLVDSVPG